ncbi:hypothetical protein ACH5RR_022831 [Cinchona calisaya]|uniref:3'-5' exonuclease domain-containing protein n=1 Tax=Cinchona calisaya TaxID=153742 RepID=A0ABD2ZA07_9GENT
MNIPLQLKLKMGIYNIQINGVSIKVRVVDDESLVESGVDELNSKLRMNLPIVGKSPRCEVSSTDHLLVGIDFKFQKQSTRPSLLLIYAKDFCLIVQLGRMSTFPETLATFLRNKSKCFVGFKIGSKFSSLINHSFFHLGKSVCSTVRNGVEICELAAMVLKKPALQKCGGLLELAREIGFDMKEAVNMNKENPDWSALCFSPEEVKYALDEAYNCYQMGKKLLSML